MLEPVFHQQRHSPKPTVPASPDMLVSLPTLHQTDQCSRYSPTHVHDTTQMAFTHNLRTKAFDAPGPNVVLLFQQNSTGLGLAQQLIVVQITSPQQRDPILVVS